MACGKRRRCVVVHASTLAVLCRLVAYARLARNTDTLVCGQDSPQAGCKAIGFVRKAEAGSLLFVVTKASQVMGTLSFGANVLICVVTFWLAR